VPTIRPTPPPPPAVLKLLARVQAGGVLVTGTRLARGGTRKLTAELDGRRVSGPVARKLIRRRLVVRVSATKGTETWGVS
jgi:hypothetical protein